MKRPLTPLLIVMLSLSASAQVEIASYGESTLYVSVGRELRLADGVTPAAITDINRAFSASAAMQPDPDTDPGTPAFFGGWGFADGTGEDFDFAPQVGNDGGFAGGFDGPYFSMNVINGTEETFGYLMMFDVDPVLYGQLNGFLFSALRSTGTGNSAGARAVIRVGSSYYIGSTETAFGGGYAEQSLNFSSLETYNPASAIVYTPGTSASLAQSDQVTAVGVYFERRWNNTAATGDARFGVGKISVTATTSGIFNYGFSESAAHVSSGRVLRKTDGTGAAAADINRAFSSSAPMEPVWGSDPGVGSFFGGWGYADGTGEVLDFAPQFANNQALAGGNDGPLFALNVVAGVAETFGYLMMFNAAPFDYQDLTSAVFAAVRTTGTGNVGGARIVVRVGANYYIGSNETLFDGTYGDRVLDFASLETYNPATAIVYTPGIATPLNPTDQIDAVGVYFERIWTALSPAGNSRLWVGKIAIGVDLGVPVEAAIPELFTSTSGSDLVITVPSETGFKYQLQSPTSGLTGWTNVPGQLLPGTGADLIFTQPLPAAGNATFYRVDASVAP